MRIKSTVHTEFFSLLILVLFLSCTSEPKSDEAVVSEAKEVKQETDQTSRIYLPAGNFIKWVGTKPTGRHNGTIRISKGYISVQNDILMDGTFEMDMNDIKILDLVSDPGNHEKLSNHLKSEDFFDVENYPLGKFQITSLAPYEANEISESKENEFFVKNPNFTTVGNLTLRDNALSISFPCRIMTTDSSYLISAAFNIDRTRWGISYKDETKVEGRIKDKFIYNKVNIAFDLEFKK